MEKLHYFNIIKNGKHHQSLVINQDYEVVHEYNGRLYDEHDNYTKEYLEFLEQIDFTKSQAMMFFQQAKCLSEAIGMVYVKNKLAELTPENSKFIQEFSTNK